jgi:hypothetical protein
MSLPFSIRPEAAQDMAEARDWYERQRDGLGMEFLAAVDDVFAYIDAKLLSASAISKSCARLGAVAWAWSSPPFLSGQFLTRMKLDPKWPQWIPKKS